MIAADGRPIRRCARPLPAPAPPARLPPGRHLQVRRRPGALPPGADHLLRVPLAVPAPAPARDHPRVRPGGSESLVAMATTTRAPRRKRTTPASKPRAAARRPRLSVGERVARGRAARAEAPRSSHARFEPSPGRPDPLTVLERQAATRVPELVPIRYGRMLVSPFTFYRGAAMIMADDLARTPRSGLTVQCCGDAHLSNFGVFASPERRLVFDLNDFDETLPGPWEWDVKRLAVSMLIAAVNNGYSVKSQERIVLGAVAAYRTAMAGFAGMGNLDVWYAHMDVDGVMKDLGGQLKPKLRK